MRIAFFGYINKDINGGSAHSLLNLMDEMKKRGHEIYLVTSVKNVISKMNERGIKCIYLLSYTMRRDIDNNSIKSAIILTIKKYVNNFAIFKGTKMLAKYNLDLIHINGIDNHVGASIAKTLNIPYYWHIRQLLQEDLGKTLFGEQEVMRYMSQANGVIAISKAVKNKYEKILNCPVRVIYNGIPLKNYDLGKVNRFTEEKTRMLLAGRITKNKGQMEAIKAISLLKKRGKNNVVLTLVGNAEAEYLATIKKTIQAEKLEDCIRILDYCDNLNELRRNSDIGLVCSKNEAFGRVTVEYMCAEMLVIGANTGGTVELVTEETGLLYQQGDPVDLANKIEYAITNSEKMKKIAWKSKEYAFSNFSIERVCDEILDYYSSPDIYKE